MEQFNRSKYAPTGHLALLALLAVSLLVACSNGIQDHTFDTDGGLELSVQATTSHSVPNSESDAEEWGGTVYTTSPVLELGYKDPSTGLAQTTGVRFAGVDVPRGVTITSAYIDFVAVTSQSDTTSLRIHGQNVGSAGPFVNGASNGITNRAKTSSSVLWTPSAWVSGTKYSTPNLANVVSEITSRSDWVRGGAIAFVISGTGQRKAHAWDAGNGFQPLLRLTYSTTSSIPSCVTSSNPTTYTATQNLRIQNLPANAQVSLAGQVVTGSPAVVVRNNGDNLCLSGGTLKTDAQDDSDWDSVFHSGRNFVNVWNSKRVRMERLAGHTAGDGLHIESNNPNLTNAQHAENWMLSHSYFRHVGDDIVDNDMRAAGTIDNLLVDWAHTGVACRGYAQGLQRVPGAMTVSNTLFAIKPQASGAGGRNTYYSPFKWDTAQTLAEGSRTEYRKPCPLALNNVTIYMAPTPSGASERPIFAPRNIDPVEYVTACNKVTFLFGGTGYSDWNKKQLDKLQAKFGPTCFKILEGSAARSEWNKQRDAWFARHHIPGFEHIQYYRSRQPLTP
jgi:hypothetical protein